MRGIREWKAYARQALKGNYLLPILGTVTVAGVDFLGGMLASSLFPGNSVMDIVLGQICSFIITLVLCVFSAGLYYMFLNIARGKPYFMSDLIYFFKNHPDRVITASFVLAVIQFVVSIPCNYFVYTSDMGTTVESQAAWAVQYLVLFGVSVVLNILVSVPFTLSYYLLADHVEMGGFEALKTSARMMKGKNWKYLLMEISFIPWLLLSVFTLYIGLLWIMPYMEMSAVMFYRDLCGEFEQTQEVLQGTVGPGFEDVPSTGNGDYFGEDGTMQNEKQVGNDTYTDDDVHVESDTHAEDDYNSEA